MKHRRGAAVLAALVVALPAWACGPRRVNTITRPGQDLVVLLPDGGDGPPGGAVVSNSVGTVTLTAERDSTTVTANQPPTSVTTISADDVQRLFGDVLTALRPPPRHFVLYFYFDSDELTKERRALISEILESVKSQPYPDVVIVGHTDTTGSPKSNFELGLRRATTVRGLLDTAGLDRSIEVTSHGEADLLIQTADDVAEPRNRRVEITVR